MLHPYVKDSAWCMAGEHTVPREDITKLDGRRICVGCKEKALKGRKKLRNDAALALVIKG